MSNTKIEWADKRWNPITGCTPVGAGCDNCYARSVAERFGRSGFYPKPEPLISGRSGLKLIGCKDFSKTLLHPDRLDRPLRWRQKKEWVCGSPRCDGVNHMDVCGTVNRPLRIFVNSMGDLFHEDVPEGWINKVHDTIFDAAGHTFIILTKRPERAKDYYKALYDAGHSCSFSPRSNLHLYVSVWDQESADRFIPILLDTPAAVRGVSIEPMLGPITLYWHDYLDHLDHVILGGETGRGARTMNDDWAKSVRDQCQEAGVPFFFKGHGTHHTTKKHRSYMLLDGRKWEELP